MSWFLYSYVTIGYLKIQLLAVYPFSYWFIYDIHGVFHILIKINYLFCLMNSSCLLWSFSSILSLFYVAILKYFFKRSLKGDRVYFDLHSQKVAMYCDRKEMCLGRNNIMAGAEALSAHIATMVRKQKLNRNGASSISLKNHS